MKNEYLITTDQQGVRDFRNLRQSLDVRSVVPEVRTPADGQVNVVVEIPGTLDTDQPTTVAQVTLVNGEWVKVRDRQVRRIGSGSVSGPVRMIATRVGSLGLCVRAES